MPCMQYIMAIIASSFFSFYWIVCWCRSLSDRSHWRRKGISLSVVIVPDKAMGKLQAKVFVATSGIIITPCTKSFEKDKGIARTYLNKEIKDIPMVQEISSDLRLASEKLTHK